MTRSPDATSRAGASACRRARRARGRARADAALAHGHVLAEAAARARHVGRARRRAHRALSGGRLQITVHAAGEVVPAFEVLDAVGSGVAEMGHTAAFYWQGKMPAATSSPPCRSG